MPHIHTKPGQHDLTVSAFILNPAGDIFVLKHKKLERWMQPGGHVELAEDPWTALLREIEEETGYTPGQLLLHCPSMNTINNFEKDPKVFHPYPMSFNTHSVGQGDHFHTDLGYAFTVLDTEPELEQAEGESRDIRWLSLSDIDSTEYNIPRNVRVIMKFVMTDVLHEWPLYAVSNLEE